MAVIFPDVSLDMPDELDLSHLRGMGRQPGEAELPEGGAASQSASGTLKSEQGHPSVLMKYLLNHVILVPKPHSSYFSCWRYCHICIEFRIQFAVSISHEFHGILVANAEPANFKVVQESENFCK